MARPTTLDNPYLQPTIEDGLGLSDRSLMRALSTHRDGIADYACQVLINDFDIVGSTVQVFIIDIIKMTNSDKREILGKSKC